MTLAKPDRHPKPPEWMVVYIAYNVPEAHIVAGRLQAEGIQTMVHSEAGASALGIHIGSMGEVKVLVKPADYESALDILEPEDKMPGLLDTTSDIIYDMGEDED